MNETFLKVYNELSTAALLACVASTIRPSKLSVYLFVVISINSSEGSE